MENAKTSIFGYCFEKFGHFKETLLLSGKKNSFRSPTNTKWLMTSLRFSENFYLVDIFCSRMSSLNRSSAVLLTYWVMGSKAAKRSRLNGKKWWWSFWLWDNFCNFLTKKAAVSHFGELPISNGLNNVWSSVFFGRFEVRF